VPRKSAPSKKKVPTSSSKARGKSAAAKRKTASTARKKTSKRAASTGKTTRKKVAKTASKAAPARVSKAAKKKVSKKTTKKKVSKKTTKKVSSKAASKKVVKKTSRTRPSAAAGKSAAKKTAAKSSGSKKTTAAKSPGKTSTGGKSGGAGKKVARKGITIVSNKKKSRPRASGSSKSRSTRPPGTQLLGPNSPVRKPLIPSGPGAAVSTADASNEAPRPTKSPIRKRELERFRAILLAKRAVLVGDVSQLESEALSAGGGALSHTPQHMAEQGSDSAEQTLSLDLAAADRKLIHEIDDAIKRIDEGRFGLCEMTGKPIRIERLRELPWARYSIEAARELERRRPSGVW